MKRNVPRIQLDNEYTNVRRDLSESQLAKIGAVVLSWNGLEIHIDNTLGLLLNLPDGSTDALTTRINGIEGKLQLIQEFIPHIIPAEFSSWFPKFNDTVAAAKNVKSHRDAVTHSNVANLEATIGTGKGRRATAYEVLLTEAALDSLYNQISATMNEFIAIEILVALINGKEKHKNSSSRSTKYYDYFIGLTLDKYNLFYQKRSLCSSLPAVPSVFRERKSGLQSFISAARFLVEWNAASESS